MVKHFELALYLCDKDYQDDRYLEDEGLVDGIIRLKLKMEPEDFDTLIDKLLPLIGIVKSSVTKKTLIGFGDNDKGFFLSKIECSEEE